MLIKFLTFSIFLLAIDFKILAEEADPYVMAMHDKKYLRLQDGKESILVRKFNEIGPSNHMRLFLRKNGKVLWDVTYHDDLEIVWADAHFIPLFDKEFIADLNNDSYPEIAVAVWHGGNAVRYCKAIIFSVKEDKLVPLATHEINYEFSRSVFKNKAEANLKNESHKGI